MVSEKNNCQVFSLNILVSEFFGNRWLLKEYATNNEVVKLIANLDMNIYSVTLWDNFFCFLSNFLNVGEHTLGEDFI